MLLKLSLTWFALTLFVLTGPALAASRHAGPFTAKDFLWDNDTLPRKYEAVVLATVNRIHSGVRGCDQMDTENMALADVRPPKVARFFVWCNYDPPSRGSFKVYFDARGRLLGREINTH